MVTSVLDLMIFCDAKRTDFMGMDKIHSSIKFQKVVIEIVGEKMGK